MAAAGRPDRRGRWAAGLPNGAGELLVTSMDRDGTKAASTSR